MDIQRKSGSSQPQKQFSVSPVFPERSSFYTQEQRKEQKIIPQGEHILGEEELRYQPVLPRREALPEQPVFLQTPRAKPSPAPRQPRLFLRPIHLSLFSWLPKKMRNLSWKRAGWVLLALLVLVVAYGVGMKGTLEKTLQEGIQNTEAGLNSLEKKDFSTARVSFLQAEKNFQQVRRQTLYFPAWLAKPLTVVPGISKFGSGILAADASAHLARAALEATTVMEALVHSRDQVDQGVPLSYIAMLDELETPLQDIRSELTQANHSLSFIPTRDIPEESRMTFELLKKGVPSMVGGIDAFLANKPLVEELLGKNGPRIYLFLFQNNQELRPTGGFIGSYGILEFKNGHARRFFIDGIFNPDGQLKENIVPPKPIQKMSAGWSLHDSNWFPDFPTSAEKAIFFYEKTGGPTVDGVFTLTPTVMERLLALTGPIELPEYDMVVDSKNFIPTIQEQVEIKYDRTENKPKKVLADLSSILMERVFALTDPLALYQVADILVGALNERQILLYTRNPDTQALIEASGWSGKIDQSPYDYVSVVHTNINGYKTDGVIDDAVEHRVQVEEDGSVLATTVVTRVHKGGNTPYEWWNKVNSNYLRVYVPQGSKLVNATGQTREFPPAPLDYPLLGFKEDPAVTQEEGLITVDEATGTRVGEEFGKTVFGNWVYVSPGETVKVEYTYLLPFRIDPEKEESRSYSLLFQKQPGMDQVRFTSSLTYPKGWDIYWQSEPELPAQGDSGIQVERTLRSDMFWGVIFKK